LNYKEMMIGQANFLGKSSLHAYTIGVITAIIADKSYTADEKVSAVSAALGAINEVWDDKSLPYDYADVKKAPLPEEVPKEILHPDCIVNVTKVQSFLEPWYLERILRDGGGMK